MIRELHALSSTHMQGSDAASKPANNIPRRNVMGLEHPNNEELRWTAWQQHTKQEKLPEQPQSHHLMLTDPLI